jgi:hypothetical protein
MDKTLKIFGLELCHAFSKEGSWVFKKENGDWYFRQHNSHWRLLAEEDISKMLDKQYAVRLPKAVRRTNKKRIKTWVEKILCSATMQGEAF